MSLKTTKHLIPKKIIYEATSDATTNTITNNNVVKDNNNDNGKYKYLSTSSSSSSSIYSLNSFSYDDGKNKNFNYYYYHPRISYSDSSVNDDDNDDVDDESLDIENDANDELINSDDDNYLINHKNILKVEPTYYWTLEDENDGRGGKPVLRRVEPERGELYSIVQCKKY